MVSLKEIFSILKKDKANSYFTFIEECRTRIPLEYLTGLNTEKLRKLQIDSFLSQNRGLKEIHLHHIIPKHWFDSGENEQLYCNSAKNLI